MEILTDEQKTLLNDLDTKNYYNVDTTIEDEQHIKKLDSFPEIEACEISETACQTNSIGKEKAIKNLKGSLNKNDYMDSLCSISFSLTLNERNEIRNSAKNYGFKSVEDYVKFVVLNAKINVTV